MHLDVERIQRLLHGELDAAAERTARDHLAGCAECRASVADAEREDARVFGLLGTLGSAVPAVSAGHVVARARADAAARWGRRAAVVALSLGAASVAYALPGSPVREWVREVVRWVRGPAPQDPVQDGPAGVAVEAGAAFRIVFTHEQARGVVTVMVVDRQDVAARRLGGAARFTSDEDRLVIDNAGAIADYEIELPQSTPWIELRVGGRRALLKDGDRVITDAPVDARGRYVVRLAGGP